MNYEPKLGRCCVCLGTENVRTILQLHVHAPIPGTGWGCVVCHKPTDGAIAVACDACCEKHGQDLPKVLVWICIGYASEDRRLSYLYEEEQPGSPKHFDHDLALHKETWKCARCGCTEETPCATDSDNHCYWVTGSLCSKCATIEEIKALNRDYAEQVQRQNIEFQRWLYNRKP